MFHVAECSAVNINADYVTGFCEGEAAFAYNIQNDRAYPVFSVRQNSDGSDIVAGLREFFGVGKVYACAARGKTRQSAYYRVNRKDDLPVIVKHFTEFPLRGAGKLAVFYVWCALVNAYLSGQDRSILVELAERLTALQLKPCNHRKRNSK